MPLNIFLGTVNSNDNYLTKFVNIENPFVHLTLMIIKYSLILKGNV